MRRLKPSSRLRGRGALTRAAIVHCLVWLTTTTAAGPAVAQEKDVTALSLEQLLDIPVVGASKYDQKQKDIAAAVSVLTRQEIETFGWRTLADALASLPGLYTTYDRQYTYLGARGFGLPGDFNTRLLLTIDGNRVNDAVYDQAYIGRDFPLDMALVERIEFVPGPGGAVYGQNAMLGTVNVVTRGGAALNGTEVVALYGHQQQAGEGRVSWGRQLGHGVEALVSISAFRAHGASRFMTFGAADVSGVATGLDGERDTHVLSRVSKGTLSFELVHGDRRKDDPTGVYLSDPLAPGTYQRDRMWLAQVQYQKALRADTLQLSSRLFVGSERYAAPETFGGQATQSSAASAWQGVESCLLVTAWSRHKTMVGVEYQVDTRQDQAYDNYVTTPGAVDTKVARSGWRAGVYVQDEATLSRTVAATLGLRHDRNSVTTGALSPRAGLRWEASQTTTVKALYGRAHRAPNVYEHDYEDGVTQVANPGLGRESINTVELVVDHRPARDLVVRGSVYAWHMNGLIVLGADPVSGLPRYQNGDDVTASGVEMSADKIWPWGGRVRGSTSYQHVTYMTGARPSNSPQWLEKLNASSRLGSMGLRLGYELQCSSARQAIDGSPVGGYCLSNLHLAAAPSGKGLGVSLSLGNLFDTVYAQPGSRNNWQTSLTQDGRTATIAARYAF